MPNSVIIEAASILVREGIEALLIIAALAAFLLRSGNRNGLRALYGGASLALLSSLAMAWVFERFYNGAHDDLLEGVTILAAAALMLYASGWMFLRQNPVAWQAYLRQQIAEAAAVDRGWALGALAFLAVFREGAETVLFLHAAAQGAGGAYGGVLIGVAIGGVVLVLLFWLARAAAIRLPLRPVFIATSALLFLMALRFVGAGLQEFQELTWVPVHDAGLPAWWIDLGLNPSLEAVAAQALIAVAAAATVAWSLRRSGAKGARAATI